MPRNNSILFLLKKNGLYSDKYSTTAKSGLLVSAKLTAEELHKHLGIETHVEICIDANEIDKFITRYKPKFCVIEALWVMPAKFFELTKIHKRVTFIVRVHSEIPFLAMEGNAVQLIKECAEIRNVFIAFNSFDTFKDFTNIIEDKNLYLPNIYTDKFCKSIVKPIINDTIHISSFGAIRPLKNQLLSAFAAIEFAFQNHLKLKFYINASRTEQGGESVLKNIIALFKDTEHQLIQCGWMNRDNFLKLIKTMDIGLQVSFNESFNIVTADFVISAIPIIVSEGIKWMPELTQADMLSMDSIVSKITQGIDNKKRFVNYSQKHLKRYNKKAIAAWLEFINEN